MLAIKNNVMAENAARFLDQSYGALAKSVQRLSSGLRIVGAQDDAAGLAVRELMRADVAVLRQASRNAQDGISMLQTGEAAMQTIDNLLVRMKELAAQAATGTYTTTQTAMMDSEFQEMVDEVDRIAGAVQFNGTNLLNDDADVDIQVGTTDADTITVTLADVTADGLGIDSISIATAASAAAALGTLDSAIAVKDSARASFGAKMNRLDATISVLGVQAENLVAAESRISDVDVAREVSILTRNQVLAQAGIAMIAQANTMPQLALSLLR